MSTKKEFRVNEYITLKLEDNKTFIYVKNQVFKQCKYLLLTIPIDKISVFSEIESIDEASEKLNREMENRTIFPPEVEFWGHCSNLQVWYENDYDTRLLHRNIAFPLLKKLTDSGDPVAKKVMKEEVKKRTLSGNETVFRYLYNQRYFTYLEKEELESIFKSQICQDIIRADFSNRYEARYSGIPFLLTLIDMGVSSALEKLKDFIKQTAKDLDFYLLYKSKDCFKYFDEHELKSILPKKKLLEELELIYRIKIEIKSEIFASTWEDFNKHLRESSHFLVDNDCIVGLYLHDRDLGEVPKDIQHLKNLEYLKIKGKIKTVPHWICELKKLTKLDLSFNKIKIIPECLNKLINLEELNFSDNRIVELPESIRNLTNLKKLSLDVNCLTCLPDWIGDLVNLEVLDFGTFIPFPEDPKNRIETLPDSIGNLTNLKQLSISNLNLTSIPASIGNLVSLEHLNLYNNQIKQLPESIGRLSKLKVLWLNYNKIFELPDSICLLKNLEKLLVGDNQLKTLPDSIGNLAYVKEINLNRNPYTTIPQSLGKLDTFTVYPIIEKLANAGDPIATEILSKNSDSMKK